MTTFARHIAGLLLVGLGSMGATGCESSSPPDDFPNEATSSASVATGTGGGGTGGGAGGQGGAGGAEPACGDGVVTATEECDDANTDPGDGCDPACSVEKGYTCEGAPSQCATECGDGIPAGAEGCDDGNGIDGDGCDATCKVENGYSCEGEPSECEPGCGDGIIAGPEQCDDGDTDPDDGCDAACAVQTGYTCTGEPSICDTTCGDGILAGAELCDDANTTEDDGCDAACVVESGYTCTGAPSTCATTCGDAIVAGAEACDDADTDPGDGCDPGCSVETGYTCTGSPSACTAVCGDGLILGGEACDDANLDTGDGCDPACAIEGGWTCDGAPSACSAVCGDGLVVGPEACDDANADPGDGCDPTCAAEEGYACTGAPSACAAVCGDGLLVAAEACDDANTDVNDGCDATCAIEPGWGCSDAPSSCFSVCGDALIVGAEQCDDGGNTPGDGCDDICQLQAGFTCAGEPSVCSTTCGDGIVAGTEGCDDGDADAGDGCAPACLVETGYACAGTPSACSPICGDGLLVASEVCDDGNAAGSDGCNASCSAVEPGYTCSGTPSACASVCGDGIAAIGDESCDDANTVDGDCCSATCQAELGCETEPNNLAATANDFDSMSVGFMMKGYITPTTDVDIFSITIPQGKSATLTAETLDGFLGTTCASGDVDTLVTVRDSAASVLNSNDDKAAGNKCSLITVSGLLPGEYYIEVMKSPSAGASSTFDYTLSIGLQLFTCGNGIKESIEQCDDGNQTNNDGCSANCTIEIFQEYEPNNTCGIENGPIPLPAIIAGGINPLGDADFFKIEIPNWADLRIETFDANGSAACSNSTDTVVQLRAPDCTTVLATHNDKASSNYCSLIDSSTVAAARHLKGTYYVRIEENLNDKTIAGYGLYISYNSFCGNGVKEGLEKCDSGPSGSALCDKDCNRIAVCGDNFIDSPETCEDGNVVSGDGCSGQCQLETLIKTETEPNNTTAEANARSMDAVPTLVTGDMHIKGIISAVGDKDYFKMTLAQASVVRFETFDPSFGDCIGMNTAIRIFDSNGGAFASDTAAAGISSCSALIVNMPAGTYYIEVEESGNDAMIATYIYEIDIQQPNTPSAAEIEPNDTIATATVLTGTDIHITGGHQVGADYDYYAITVPPNASVRAEIIEGGSKTCESNTMDSQLTFFTSAGVQRADDDDEGRGFCSMIDGTGSNPIDANAHALPGGTYYLRVGAHSTTSTSGQFDYKLAVTVRY